MVLCELYFQIISVKNIRPKNMLMLVKRTKYRKKHDREKKKTTTIRGEVNCMNEHI